MYFRIKLYNNVYLNKFGELSIVTFLLTVLPVAARCCFKKGQNANIMYRYKKERLTTIHITCFFPRSLLFPCYYHYILVPP